MGRYQVGIQMSMFYCALSKAMLSSSEFSWEFSQWKTSKKQTQYITISMNRLMFLNNEQLRLAQLTYQEFDASVALSASFFMAEWSWKTWVWWASCRELWRGPWPERHVFCRVEENPCRGRCEHYERRYVANIKVSQWKYLCSRRQQSATNSCSRSRRAYNIL